AETGVEPADALANPQVPRLRSALAALEAQVSDATARLDAARADLSPDELANAEQRVAALITAAREMRARITAALPAALARPGIQTGVAGTFTIMLGSGGAEGWSGGLSVQS